MIDHLPPSLRGLMVAAFAAAYHVHDRDAAQLGRQLSGQRFLSPFPERLRRATSTTWSPRSSATVLLTIVSAVVTFYMDSIAGAWKL